MRIRLQQRASTFVFDLEPEPADFRRPIGRRTFEVQVPAEVRSSEIHPDLMGLALVLVCRPSTARRLTLPIPVSSSFASAVASVTELEVGPVDDALAPRRLPEGGVNGLAFSGGVDSVAALELLPEDTIAYFLDRVEPDGAPPTLLSSEAGRDASRALAAAGRNVRVIPSDLEYVRPQPGFPEHYANAVPMLLCADHDRLRTAGWGLVSESAYRVGRVRYVPYFGRAYNQRWHTLFAAAGLPMCSPTMGVSEVGTTRLTLEGRFSHLAQSCVRGPLGQPCRACVKCFRKRLLVAGHTGDWPDGAELDSMLQSFPVRSYLASAPLKQPLGVAWALQKAPSLPPLLGLVAERVEAHARDLSFVERWYGPAATHWPEVDRGWLTERLDDRLGRMTPRQESAFRSWDVEDREHRRETARLGNAVGHLLDVYAERGGGRVRPVATPPPGEGVPHDLERLLKAERNARVAAEQEAAKIRASTSFRLGHRLVRAGRPLTRLLRR
jgi:hypothetical protein